MPFYKDASFWLSVITVVIAVIALFQSHKQIKISNKQHLFDKRLDAYLLFNSLFNMYSSCRKDIKKIITEEIFDGDFSNPFGWLTNIGSLEKLNNTLEAPWSEKKYTTYVEGMDALKQTATKVTLLWKQDEAEYVSEFIMNYEKLLHDFYLQQQCLLDLDLDKNRMNNTEYFEQAKENALRIGLPETIQNLDKNYHRIIDTQAISNLKKEMKLYKN